MPGVGIFHENKTAAGVTHKSCQGAFDDSGFRKGTGRERCQVAGAVTPRGKKMPGVPDDPPADWGRTTHGLRTGV